MQCALTAAEICDERAAAESQCQEDERDGDGLYARIAYAGHYVVLGLLGYYAPAESADGKIGRIDVHIAMLEESGTLSALHDLSDGVIAVEHDRIGIDIDARPGEQLTFLIHNRDIVRPHVIDGAQPICDLLQRICRGYHADRFAISILDGHGYSDGKHMRRRLRAIDLAHIGPPMARDADEPIAKSEVLAHDRRIDRCDSAHRAIDLISAHQSRLRLQLMHALHVQIDLVHLTRTRALHP